MPLPSWHEIQRHKATLPALIGVVVIAVGTALYSMRGPASLVLNEPGDVLVRELLAKVRADPRFANLGVHRDIVDPKIIVIEGEVMSSADKLAFDELLPTLNISKEFTVSVHVEAKPGT